MIKREFNRTTESFWTEEEYQKLEELGFSWSNASVDYHGYSTNNSLYKIEKGISYNISVRENGCFVQHFIPTLFGSNQIWETSLTFEELLDTLNISFLNKIKLNLLKINSIPVGIIFIIIHIFLLPFFNIKNKWNILKSRIKDIFTFNKFFIQDAIPFIWGFNMFSLGIITTILVIM